MENVDSILNFTYLINVLKCRRTLEKPLKCEKWPRNPKTLLGNVSWPRLRDARKTTVSRQRKCGQVFTSFQRFSRMY